MRHRDQGRRIVRKPGDLFDAPRAQRVGIVHRSLPESLPWNPLEAVGFFEIGLGFLGSLITAWFSRQREFRADRGGAMLAGRDRMLGALRRLAGGVRRPAGAPPD